MQPTKSSMFVIQFGFKELVIHVNTRIKGILRYKINKSGSEPIKKLL